MIKPDRIERIKIGKWTYLLVYSSGTCLKIKYTRELWPSVKAMIKDFSAGYKED